MGNVGVDMQEEKRKEKEELMRKISDEREREQERNRLNEERMLKISQFKE